MKYRRVVFGRRAFAAGFTLVELLIAFVLMAMIAAALASAVGAIGQAQERVDERLERADEQRVVVSFLERILQRTIARKRPVTQEQQSPFYFVGRPEVVMWMGLMPANYGAGGRTLFRLALEPRSPLAGNVLMLRWVEWGGEMDFPDWAAAQSRELVVGAQSVSMRYLDAEKSREWVTQWVATDSLPERIEIRIVTPSGTWPPIVSPLYLQGSERYGADGFSFGGAP